MKVSNWPDWVTHGRSFGLGVLALLCALNGQRIARDEQEAGVPASVFWYGLGILLFILAIWGTYKRRSMLAVKPAQVVDGAGAGAGSEVGPLTPTLSPAGRGRFGSLRERFAASPIARYVPLLRWVLTGVALLMGFFAMQTIRQDFFSATGMWLFLGSMVLLLLAWVGERVERWRDETELPATQADAEVSTDWRVPWQWEAIYVALVCAVALAVRLYQLGYLVWGMHGDEGEAATDAIAILDGRQVSPFTTGWFSQPNVYYYSIAISLKLFGMDVAGLRMSAVIFSLLAMPFFYLLLRRMFGVRAAFIATGLLATNAIFLHYSRVQFSNITTPVFWIIGFYFLFRGFRSRRMTDFILAGYLSFFSLYFYNGARILPFMIAGLFVYMAIFQRHFLRRYWSHALMFLIASYLVSSPFIAYYLDHATEMNARSGEKLIYNNMDAMRGMYGEPFPVVLPGGISFTPSEHVYYFWRQFTLTVSMFTFRPTASSIYYFTHEPIVNFLESALLILGMGMAFWRWRDTRYALLLIWFWASFIAGGVLTVEAPYTDRLVGIFPTLVVFVALTANKLLAEWVAFWRAVPRPELRALGATVATVAAVLLTVGLATRNATDYLGSFVWNYWMTDGAAQAYFVEQNGADYKYYEIGHPFALDFNNGGIRFQRLALDIDGRDMFNIGNSLPLVDSNGKDVLFLVNNGMETHLRAILDYYPEATAGPWPYGRDGEISTFSSISIPKEVVAAKQRINVTYTPEGGQPLKAKVNAIGTAAQAPPVGATYPMTAQWVGGLYAPGFAQYGFQLTAPPSSTLAIDGRLILTVPESGQAEQEVILSRGVHSIAIDATLTAEGQEVTLLWRAGGEPWTPVAPLYLWDGPLGGLEGEVYPQRADAISGGLDVRLEDPPAGGPPISRRTDNVIDFRDPSAGLETSMQFTARWRGKFVAPESGNYGFETLSRADSGVWIDGQPVIINTDAGDLRREAASLELAAGEHDIEVRYNWSGGHQVLVFYVTPPGGEQVVANGTMFAPAPGVWLPGELEQAPVGGVNLSQTAELGNEKVIRLSGLAEPRSLAVGPDGNLYVADTENARVVVFDQEGNQLRAWGERGNGEGQFMRPADLVFNEAGELYVADHELGGIYVFDSGGTLLRTIGSDIAPLSSPNGLAIGPDGDLFVANTAGSNLLRLEPDGSGFRVLEGGAPGSATHLDQPVDVLAAPSGAVYAVDLRDRVVRLDDSGVFDTQWSLAIGRFLGTAKLAWLDDRLYITNPDTGQLAELDPATGAGIIFRTSSLSEQLARPTGIAAAGDELFVLDAEKQLVHVFSFER